MLRLEFTEVHLSVMYFYPNANANTLSVCVGMCVNSHISLERRDTDQTCAHCRVFDFNVHRWGP